jgi:branched-subunit amino acid ABC-type transport system permease component
MLFAQLKRIIGLRRLRLRGPSGAKAELQKVPKIFEKRRVLALCARRVLRTCQHQECYFFINSSFRIVDNITTPAEDGENNRPERAWEETLLALSLTLNGLVLGSILLLFSLGLTLIYGVGRIVNFAHGALFSSGALAGAWLTHAGLSFWSALVIAPLLIGLVSLVLDWAVLARIRDRPMVDSLLLTFGLALLITGVLYQLGGRSVVMLQPPSTLDGTMTVAEFSLPTYRLFVSCLAIGTVTALLFFLKSSSWGLRVRAANDDPEMGACLGIDREGLMHSVVAISGALAALSGVAAAPIFTAYATVGDKILILAFMTVILGGLGSLRGAIVAAYVVGLIIVFGEGYLGGQAALLLLFVLMMAMLIQWPRGFFGEGRIE